MIVRQVKNGSSPLEMEILTEERDAALLEVEHLHIEIQQLRTQLADQQVRHDLELHRAKRVPADRFAKAVEAGRLAHGHAYNGRFYERFEDMATAIAAALGVEVGTP